MELPAKPNSVCVAPQRVLQTDLTKVRTYRRKEPTQGVEPTSLNNIYKEDWVERRKATRFNAVGRSFADSQGARKNRAANRGSIILGEKRSFSQKTRENYGFSPSQRRCARKIQKVCKCINYPGRFIPIKTTPTVFATRVCGGVRNLPDARVRRRLKFGLFAPESRFFFQIR